MIRPLLVVVAILTCGAISLLVGTLFPEFRYKVIQPCGLSKWFGSTEKERNLGLLESFKWRVVDGDTLWCERDRLRLDKIDAPEPEAHRDSCDSEVVLGIRARGLIRDQLTDKTKSWHVYPTGEFDKYDRPVVNLFIDGESAGDILIKEGLAQRWDNPDKDPKPTWCPPPPTTGQ